MGDTVRPVDLAELDRPALETVTVGVARTVSNMVRGPLEAILTSQEYLYY